MTVRDTVALAIAFSDNNIAHKALADEGVTIRWPEHWPSEEVDQHRRTANDAIATYIALFEADGCRVVPLVPTQTMCEAGQKAAGYNLRPAEVRNIYRTMVATAPKWGKAGE